MPSQWLESPTGGVVVDVSSPLILLYCVALTLI
jgi:hypothetical protein